MSLNETGPIRSGTRCSMSGQEVAELAWKGGEMPEWMAAPEQLLFQTVKQIAWHYRQGMPAEQASREKNLAIREYEKNRTLMDNYIRSNELWLRIALPSMEYATEPSLKAAEKFYRAVYRFPENWRRDQDSFTRALEREAKELRDLMGEAAG